jgi:hypothetical protein
MGIWSSTFKFVFNGQNWRAKLWPGSKGYRYSVWVDGALKFDEQIEQSSIEMVSPQSITVQTNEKNYTLTFGPTSAFKFGLHIYANGSRVYTYKNREFVRLPKTEKFSKKVDKFVEHCEEYESSDDRPFWKMMVESLIIGGVIGIATATASNFLERRHSFQIGDSGMWAAIGIAVALIWFLPKKYRLLK